MNTDEASKIVLYKRCSLYSKSLNFSLEVIESVVGKNYNNIQRHYIYEHMYMGWIRISVSEKVLVKALPIIFFSYVLLVVLFVVWPS